MNKKNLTIIARYNEDISWATELEGDIIIYNKGNDWSWEDIPRIDSENYGREGETFVRAVLEFYENLSEYENIIFLQGNPFEHCKEVIHIINNNIENKVVSLTDSHTLDSYPKDYYIFDKHLSLIDKLLQVKSFEFTTEVKDINPDVSKRVPDHEHFFLFEESMGLCSVLNIPYRNEDVLWATGAQYIVPVKNILNKSEQWWTNLHYLFLHYAKEKNIESISYILERIWPMIWEFTDL